MKKGGRVATEVIRVTDAVKRVVQLKILNHQILHGEKLTEGEVIRRIAAGELDATEEYREVMKAYRRGMTKSQNNQGLKINGGPEDNE